MADSITVTDLENAKLDVITIEEVATSLLDTSTDRKGNVKNTLQGALKTLGFIPPVAYAGAISFTVSDNTKTVEEAGVIYAPFPLSLPFTTSGVFIGDDDARFYVVQGVTTDNIAQYTNRNFATVAEVVANTTLNAGDFVSIENYTATNNSGVMFFEVVAAGTGTADGGSYIDLPNTAPPTQLKQNFQSSVSVKLFGAEGDGVTDDYTPIQAAINYLNNVGGEVLFPASDYAIGSTININTSGISLVGKGIDEGRVAWGNWPSRILWIGATNSKMIEIDSGLTTTVRGGTFKGLVLDGNSIANVSPLFANPSASHYRVESVIFRNYDNPVFLSQSCYGWSFTDVEIFNSQFIGIELDDLCHHTTFTRVRGSGTSIFSAQSLIRVGSSGRCSNINFIACDFEAQNTFYQVELMDARAVAVIGGYSEPLGSEAVFRLGVTATTEVNGFSVVGHYVQGGFPTYNSKYFIDVKNANAVSITGGCHFRNIQTAVINNLTLMTDNCFANGNYVESVGSGKDLFANVGLDGWTFFDDGVFTPTIVGLTSAGVNSYTTQNAQYFVDNGKCSFEIEITLDGTVGALNSTGILEIHGLPYIASGNFDYPITVGQYTGLNMTSGRILMGYVTRGASTIRLRDQTIDGTSSSSLSDVESTDDMSIKISGSYRVQ